MTVQLTTTPAIAPNVRNAYVSLLDMLSWFAFENFEHMRANGWAIKWTCDGVTGPANAGDATNRILARANFQTQAAVAAAAQSWFVLQGTDVQILFTYQGATADICRISYSPGKNFAIAGTATHQPTAADEVVIMAATSVVNNTASLDRVMSIWSTATMWSCALFRNNAFVNIIGVEKITSLCSVREVNPIFSGAVTPPYVGYRYTTAVISVTAGTVLGGPSAVAIGAAGWAGTAARIYTNAAQNTRVGGGFIVRPPTTPGDALILSDSTFNSENPALQNSAGHALIPPYWCGERAANRDGFLGVPIDWWVAYTQSLTSPPSGADFYPGWDPGDDPDVDPPRARWVVALGVAMLRPWRDAAVVMEIG